MATKPDPRRKQLTGGRTPTANEKNLDAALRHAHGFEQLKVGEANKVLAFLNDEVIPDLEERIAARLKRVADAGFDAGPATTKRLTALLEIIRTDVIEGSRALRDRLIADVIEIGRYEAEFYVGRTTRALTRPVLDALDVSFDVPSVQELRDIVRATPFQGGTLKDWAEKLGEDAVGRIEREIKIGLVNGETADQVARRVFGSAAESYEDGAVALLRSDADKITRSAVQHMGQASRDAVADANPDIFSDVDVWVATLDNRTCVVCGGLDGKSTNLPAIPVHFLCRCFKERQIVGWKEFGLTDADLASVPGMRAALRGPVDATLTYPDWLRTQDLDTQREILGPTRFQLWRSEKSLSQFVDDRSRPYTIAQLKSQDDRLER